MRSPAKHPIVEQRLLLRKQKDYSPAISAKYYPLTFRNLSPQSAQRTQRKIENEKSLSIFKKILCLVFPIPLSVRSVFSVVKILAGTADYSQIRRRNRWFCGSMAFTSTGCVVLRDLSLATQMA